MKYRPLLLQCSVQHYDWGKVGAQSIIAQITGRASEAKPFAELWMGAHPKAPALAEWNGKLTALQHIVKSNPGEILGEKVAARWAEIPFLFKILSIAEPLSIQLHPNKEEAQKLHARDAQNYPDQNHKPEVAIALTSIELLYGLQSAAHLKKVLTEYPEIQSLVPSVRADHPHFSAQVFEGVLRSDPLAYERSVLALASRLEKSPGSRKNADTWFLRAKATFGPQDKGLLCFYLMNLCEIPAGKAIFTGPHIPHAYLSGEIVECMANSDNVVRAGLTTKFQDQETLFRLLDATVHAPTLIEPQRVGSAPGRDLFELPSDEFQVERISAAGEFKFDLSSVAIAICIKGECALKCEEGIQQLTAGSIVLFPAALKSCIFVNTDGLLFIASVPNKA
ncbi:MAG: mannose-6-phosphate isomerase, class I [Deltaproteobacteria bacterium]|nr:mannose-6-phosphate isomerase, class I [Deltaproteobacteria bacterium]